MRLAQRGARDAQCLHGNVLLIELRDELLTEPGEQGGRDSKQQNGAKNHGEWELQSASEHRPVDGLERPDKDVLLFLHPARDQDRDQGRHEGNRQNESRHKRNDHRERHGLEHLALNTRECQERGVDQDNDRLTIDGWLDHLLGRLNDGAEALAQTQLAAKFVLAFGQVAQGVLRDNDCTVDDQAEVKCP